MKTVILIYCLLFPLFAQSRISPFDIGAFNKDCDSVLNNACIRYVDKPDTTIDSIRIKNTGFGTFTINVFIKVKTEFKIEKLVVKYFAEWLNDPVYYKETEIPAHSEYIEITK
jgi:hypothetical protein